MHVKALIVNISHAGGGWHAAPASCNILWHVHMSSNSSNKPCELGHNELRHEEEKRTGRDPVGGVIDRRTGFVGYHSKMEPSFRLKTEPVLGQTMP